MGLYIHQVHYSDASLMPDGTVALPGIAFTNETSSGLARPAAGNVTMSILGVEITRWMSGVFQVSKGSVLRLQGATSGALDLRAAPVTTDYSLTAPPTQGGVGSVMTNDGSGNLAFTDVLPVENGGTGSSATLAGSAVMVSDSNEIVESTVTTTELESLTGITGNVQTQLDAKQGLGDYIENLSGDVVANGPGSVTATIQPNVVDNSKLAQMLAMTIKGNNTGSAADAADLSVSDVLAMLGGVGGGLEPGDMLPTAKSTPSAGFLMADGSAVSRTTYSDLYNAIGTTFGIGDGSTTFNIPNVSGIGLMGAGSQTISGKTYSRTLGVKQNDQFEIHSHTTNPHSHTISDPGHAHYQSIGTVAGGNKRNFTGGNTTTLDAYVTSGTSGQSPITAGSVTGVGINSTTVSVNGAGGGLETFPANLAVNYQIKY